jgi:thymidylate synthase
VISIRGRSATEVFLDACRAVVTEGRATAPRGLATREVLGAHLCVIEPRRRLVDVSGHRILNPAFAVAEALWILSGSDDPWIFDYNRGLRRWADDGRLQGAYGPRIRRWRDQIDQLDHVRKLLRRDPDSRQAVIQLFDPERDTRGHRDVPCTLGYRFFVRGGRLHMHTTMRSQDLWLGFPYDVFAATLMQELMAGWVGVELGEYHHHVDSLHLYDQHLDRAGELPRWPGAAPPSDAVAVGWDGLDRLIAEVLAGQVGVSQPVWAEFAAVLASYRDWTGGRRAAARSAAVLAPGALGEALRRWYQHLDRTASGPLTAPVPPAKPTPR